MLNGEETVAGYRLSPDPDEHSAGSPRIITRLSFTCRDIFGFKHAGIFDQDETGLWTHRTTERIDGKDLIELNSEREALLATPKAF